MGRKRNNLFLILFGAVILCSFGLNNRFPIVYSDTGTYIWSGFRNIVPIDRPIFYGFFIRHISLWTTLWLVIFAQGIIVSFLLFKTLDIFYTGNKRNYIFLFSVIFLTLFTGLSYNTSLILPDIFSAVGILCLVNLLFNNKLGKIQFSLILVLFLFSMAVHNSNFISFFLVFIFFAGYLAVKKIKKQTIIIKRNRFITCSILFLVFLFIPPTVNYAFSKNFTYSEGSSVFIINHLAETGILVDYLNDNCARKNYKLCAYTDKLDDPYCSFLWDENNSPLYKVGGWWGSKDEFNAIIFDILTTPKYLIKVIQKAIEYTCKQYFTFEVPWNIQYLRNCEPYFEIHHYFKTDEREYFNSRQNDTGINVNFTNEIQKILVFGSLALFICIMLTPILRHKLEPTLIWLSAVILLFSIINAAVCSNLSTVDNRFQDRIAWLLPFIAIIASEHLLSPFLSKKFPGKQA